MMYWEYAKLYTEGMQSGILRVCRVVYWGYAECILGVCRVVYSVLSCVWAAFNCSSLSLQTLCKTPP